MPLGLNNKKQRVVFFGTSAFGIPLLKELIDSPYQLVAVYTKQDKPQGRGLNIGFSPIKDFLLKNFQKISKNKKNIVFSKNHQKILLKQPENLKDPQAIQEFKNLRPDIAIVVSFGMLFPKDLLNTPPYGFLNLHPSLLPLYRGPSPIETVLLKQEKWTGISIIKLNEKMDAGDIILQKKIKIAPNTEVSDLYNLLFAEGKKLIVNNLDNYLQNKLSPKKQQDHLATYTKLIKKEDGLINWKDSAQKIEAQIRAFNFWPKSYTFYYNSKKKRLRLNILKAKIINFKNSQKIPCGKTFIDKNLSTLPIIATGKGAILPVILQPEGKEKMPFKDFFNGAKNFLLQTLK